MEECQIMGMLIDVFHGFVVPIAVQLPNLVHYKWLATIYRAIAILLCASIARSRYSLGFCAVAVKSASNLVTSLDITYDKEKWDLQVNNLLI